MSLEMIFGFAVSSLIIIPYEPVLIYLVRKIWKIYRGGC